VLVIQQLRLFHIQLKMTLWMMKRLAQYESGHPRHMMQLTYQHHHMSETYRIAQTFITETLLVVTRDTAIAEGLHNTVIIIIVFICLEINAITNRQD